VHQLTRSEDIHHGAVRTLALHTWTIDTTPLETALKAARRRRL
jgi:hypothetical protein